MDILPILLLSTTILAHRSHERHYHHGYPSSSEQENWGWNNNWGDQSNTNAYGAAGSNGNGYSGISAGKEGVSTEAFGTHGAMSESAFDQNNGSWGVSNGFNNNRHGSNAFSDNWGNNDSTQAATQAIGHGQAGVKSNAGKDGANVFAQGTLGTQSQLGWNNDENAWKESYAFGNRLLSHERWHNPSRRHQNKHKKYHKYADSSDDDYHENDDLSWGWNNNWANQSNTNAYGAAQTNGEGYSALSAGKQGVSTEAYGKDGANSESAFQQQNQGWGISNGFNNNGRDGNNAFSNNWGANDSTNAFTNAQGLGEAGVKSNVGQDGANVFAQGTEGTQSNLGWNNSDDNWNESFAFGNRNHRLLNNNNDESSDEEDNSKKFKRRRNNKIVKLKNLIHDLKNEIEDLHKENEELRMRCRNGNRHRVGASY